MNTAEYWKQEHNRLHTRVDTDAVELDKIYRKKLKKVEGSLNAFYTKYAIDNEITEAVAKQRLSPKEFRIFNEKLRLWIKSGKYADDKSFLKKLDRLAGTSKINRLQTLQAELNAHISELKVEQLKRLEGSLTATYKETEEATLKTVESAFNQTSEGKIRTVINSKFQGRRFSPRVWTHRANLSKKLNDTLTENFVSGKNFNNLKSSLKTTFGASDYEARRLLITETARINSVAKENSFKEAGYEMYQYLAVDDDRTTPICNGLDDRVFRLDNIQVGVNAPPTHIYCRSTIIPYMGALEEDEIEIIEPTPKPKKEPKKKPKKVDKEKAIDLGYKGRFNGYVLGISTLAKKLIEDLPKPALIKHNRTAYYSAPLRAKDGEIRTTKDKETFLHEYGHFIDHVLAQKAGHSNYFSKRLEASALEDAKLYGESRFLGKGEFRREYVSISRDKITEITDELYTYGDKTTKRGRVYSGYIVKAKEYEAVSDIFDSLTTGDFQEKRYGIYGHGKRYYQRGNMKQAENFANLFSAYSIGGKDYEAVKKYFPNLTKEFEKIMKEVTK